MSKPISSLHHSTSIRTQSQRKQYQRQPLLSPNCQKQMVQILNPKTALLHAYVNKRGRDRAESVYKRPLSHDGRIWAAIARNQRTHTSFYLLNSSTIFPFPSHRRTMQKTMSHDRIYANINVNKPRRNNFNSCLYFSHVKIRYKDNKLLRKSNKKA